MPDYNFPGGVSPRDTSSYYTQDREVESGYFNMPKGPAFSDGYRGGLVTHVRGWFSPYSGTKGVRIGLGGNYTAFHNRPAAGVKDTGWLPLNVIMPPGPYVVRFDVNSGGMRFGRSKTGKTSGVGFNVNWPGALSGQARVIWSAGPPTELRASVDNQWRVRLSWKAPTNNGGAPVTRYWVQVSTKNNFPTGGYTQYEVDNLTNIVIPGLTTGVRYYFRVLAGNLVNIRRGRGSQPSKQGAFFIPLLAPGTEPIEDPDAPKDIPYNQTEVPPSVRKFSVRGEFFNLLTNSPDSETGTPDMLPVVGRVVFVPDVRTPITAYPEQLNFVPTEIHAWIRSDGVLVAPADGFTEEPVLPIQFEDRVNLIAPSQLGLSVRNWSWTAHIVPNPGEDWKAFSLRIPGDTEPDTTVFLNEEYVNTHTLDLTRRRDPGVRSSRLYEVDYLTPPYPFGFDKELDFLVLNEDMSMWKVYD